MQRSDATTHAHELTGHVTFGQRKRSRAVNLTTSNTTRNFFLVLQIASCYKQLMETKHAYFCAKTIHNTQFLTQP